MAGSTLSISKGAMFQAADKVLATPPAGQTLTQWYRHLRQDLIDGGDSLSALAAEVNAISGPADVNHVQDALGNAGMFPNVTLTGPQREQAMREGFIAAYDLALSTQPTRPIVTFWTVVKQSDVFEVLVTSSPSQVTLFWVTSEPDGWGSCAGRVEEDMWLIAPRQRTNQVVAAFTGSVRPVPRPVGANATPPRQAGDLQITRLRGD